MDAQLRKLIDEFKSALEDINQAHEAQGEAIEYAAEVLANAEAEGE